MQTAWIWMRRQVTRRLTQIQAVWHSDNIFTKWKFSRRQVIRVKGRAKFSEFHPSTFCRVTIDQFIFVGWCLACLSISRSTECVPESGGATTGEVVRGLQWLHICLWTNRYTPDHVHRGYSMQDSLNYMPHLHIIVLLTKINIAIRVFNDIQSILFLVSLLKNLPG